MNSQRLGEICRIGIGRTPSRNEGKYWGQGNSWLSIADMKDEKFLSETKEEVTDLAVQECRMRLVPEGTLLFSFKLSVGKVGIASKDLYTNEAIASLEIIDEKKTYQPFLYHALKTLNFDGAGDRAVKGITLNKAKLNNLQIPLPPLPEQKRIADMLDKADALRKKNKELLDAYDELLKATFLDMFGDPVTNPKGWGEKYFKDVITDIVGGFSVGGEQRELREDELGVLKVSAVTSGVFEPKEYKAVNIGKIDRQIINPKKGDLLFSRANTRELVGAVAVVDQDYNRLFLPDKLWRIDLNRSLVTNYYLHRLLINERFRPELTKTATGTSGSMLNISKAKLNRLRIPLPPVGLQNQFAQIVENVEAQKALVKQSLQESEDLFNGLVQKAFKGY